MNQLGIQKPIEQIRVLEREKQYKYLGFMRKRSGQQLFEYDPEAGTVSPAPVLASDAIGVDGSKSNARLTVKKGCRYVWAINEKNARRKLKI